MNTLKACACAPFNNSHHHVSIAFYFEPKSLVVTKDTSEMFNESLSDDDDEAHYEPCYS